MNTSHFWWKATFILLALSFSSAPPALATPLDPQGLIRPDLLGRALDALKAHEARARETGRLVIVDYAKHSKEPRLYIINLETGNVTALRAAHGSGSDKDHDGFLEKFSDVPGSKASPEGAYLTAESYFGKHGLSLRLDGLDATNKNARDRAIVIHAADYAEPEMLRKHGKLGRSNGCIVFSQKDFYQFHKDVPEGTLIFVGK